MKEGKGGKKKENYVIGGLKDKKKSPECKLFELKEMIIFIKKLK